MSNIDQLKENVAATLESTGVLARIRAELRAEVFAAMEMQTPIHENIPQKMDEFTRTDIGRQSLDLILEFLQFFGLKHTLSVFKAETHRQDTTINRDSIWNAIASKSSEFSLRKPLLVSILEQKKDSTSHSVDSRPIKDPLLEGVTSIASHRVSLPKLHTKTDTKCIDEREPSMDSIARAESEMRSIRESESRISVQPDVRNVSAPEPTTSRVSDVELDRKSEPGNVPEPVHGPIRDLSNPGSTAPSNTPLPISVPKVISLATPDEPKKVDAVVDQLHQIDNLLKQLDTKQRLTDQAKAQFSSSSHLHLEELSDNDDVEFDDDDFEYEPDDIVKDDGDELFPGFSTKPPAASRPSSVECFSDDPSADENALDSFDVIHDVRQ